MSNPDEILEEVIIFFRSFLPDAPRSVCVAVSGGSDSVALFQVLNSLKEQLRFQRLAIAHVNHRLRGDESDADALFVKKMAHDAGAEFFLKELERPQSNIGLEEWGRRERYAFFRQIRETERFTFIATGHTADDQAETVLMRLMRGCGLKGLRSLLPVREDGIIRPLLSVPRESLRAWLAGRKIQFREDSSNEDLRFTRNWIRRELLPGITAKSPHSVKYLARIADSARVAWSELKPVINDWLAHNVVRKGEGQYIILKTGLIDTAIAEEAMAEFFRGKEIPFERRHVVELLSNASRSNGRFLLPKGWCYSYTKENIELVSNSSFLRSGQPEGEVPAVSYEIAVPGITVYKNEKLMFEVVKFESTGRPAFSKDNWIVYLDAAELIGPLVFRSIKPDDVFRPLGSAGLRNIHAFLKKQKIPKNGPRGRGVVVNKKGEIIWLPGVRISHAHRLTPQTRDILKISCKITR
jgi:tRNA(Ile)-lysidine synthetase, N-terminal domain